MPLDAVLWRPSPEDGEGGEGWEEDCCGEGFLGFGLSKGGGGEGGGEVDSASNPKALSRAKSLMGRGEDMPPPPPWCWCWCW